MSEYKSKRLFTLAIVGRPNVGKSTLFNRLAKKKLAIVDDTPGVTRDWRDAEAFLFDRTFRVIDTAGLEESFDESIQGRMRQQTEAALKQADAVLFVVDGRAGITPMDEHFAQWLRKQKKPVTLAVNKCEHENVVRNSIAEAYALGLGEPVPISAEHGIGMEDLYHIFSPYFPDEQKQEDAEQAAAFEEEFASLDDIEGIENYEFKDDEAETALDPEKPLKIAIVGRPNVGKSTLLNTIVGDHRVMTGPEAGITRDAIAVDWDYNGRKFRLVDTAGMRKKNKGQDKIEALSVEDTLRAIRLAQVVILVIDAKTMLEKQDIQIAEHIINEGRAIILAVNKWDEISGKTEYLDELKYQFETSLAQLKDIPFQTISALNNRNIDRLLDLVGDVYGMWNMRIKTSGLNRWLAKIDSQNPAPLVAGRRNRLKYITQVKTRPPTFAIWVARPDSLPDSHKRYIINALRRDYKIPGVPVRLLVRKSKNPFTD
jgi:GTP-binding protein